MWRAGAPHIVEDMLGARGRIITAGVVLAGALASGLPATAGGPPEEAIRADFAARHGDDWATVSVSSTSITVPADAPLAPEGLALPAEGWEVVVDADDGARTATTAFYYAVGDRFWVWQEVSSTRDEPVTATSAPPTTTPTATVDPTTTTTAPPPDPTTTAPVAEVLSAAVERPVRAPWTSAFAPWPN